MRDNLNRSRGVVFSGTVLLELARRGVSREDAYEWVQRNAMRSFAEARDFKELLLADADIIRILTPPEIDRAFDLDDQLKHVDEVFERVFHSGQVGAAREPLSPDREPPVSSREASLPVQEPSLPEIRR
jgi:adenylosuccinate lyase